ncbi:MAG: IPExxxVDY family protein [Bacteroidales bacterium]|nr:IPExxxVDY family protein [Bacteroidales bacterium]
MGILSLEVESKGGIPFSLIGINSPLANFQLAYRLQSIMDCEFEKTENFLAYKEKLKKEFPFSCFAHVNSFNGLAYLLIENLSVEDGRTTLIDGLKKIDYILLIIGRDFAEVNSVICKNIKTVKNVVYSQIFYPFASVQRETKKSDLKISSIDSLMKDIEYYKDNNSFMGSIYL